MARAIDLDKSFPPDCVARDIGELYHRWETLRNTWRQEKEELRNYVFATDTTTTTNRILDWKNSTTRPKLCQIRDNLLTNYMEGLFPTDNWLKWEGANEDSDSADKAQVIEDYMRVKTRHQFFRNTVEQLVSDWIDYGVLMVTAEWVDKNEEPTDDQPLGRVGYKGPKAVRISPLDFVFDPTAPDFEDTPKIQRQLMTVGDLAVALADNPEKGYLQEAFDRMMQRRQHVRGASTRQQFVFGSQQGDAAKDQAFQRDGFSSYREYLQSDFVEVLDFYGSILDRESGTLEKDVALTVVDRTFIVRRGPIPHWVRGRNIITAPWRSRPDNLYGMGPLDNLVGMQYRIDHLENLKADVFDLIAVPTIKVTGSVPDFQYGPNAKIFVGDEGDVDFLRPPTEALTADVQIDLLEREMEAMAGAPREAMGFRSPGEKTKFEVQQLENAANRMFIHKLKKFDELVMEPLLNLMLETARRNMDGTDVLRVVDEYGVAVFNTITREDIVADGLLRPLGSTKTAARANMLQNLLGLTGSAMGQDPQVKVHWSGEKLAKVGAELIDGKQFDLFQPNIRVTEQLNTQRLAQAGEEQVNTEALTPAGVTEDDVG